MKQVRLGIIGMGKMGRQHFRFAQTVKRCRVTAVCDVDQVLLKEFDAKPYSSPRALFKSGLVNAVLIATPHFDHTPLAIQALKAGLHVLVEKPIASHISDAQAMIAAHRNRRLIFAAMFNQRVEPTYAKMKAMVQKGELGKIRRTNWIITNWFRSQAYYASASWRATWKGEGGGVLLNQCPHNLDILQWIAGMPRRVTANIGLGKFHRIEVEDEVNVLLEYPNGATGVFVTTTGEAPGTNRFEIIGEKGKLVTEHEHLTFYKNRVETGKFSRTTDKLFESPPFTVREIPLRPLKKQQHTFIIDNFVKAILDRKPLIAPAREGLNSLMLGNAMLLSGIKGKPVDLPLGGRVYASLLNNLIKRSVL
jgi:predicted dehydrogenase